MAARLVAMRQDTERQRTMSTREEMMAAKQAADEAVAKFKQTALAYFQTNVDAFFAEFPGVYAFYWRTWFEERDGGFMCDDPSSPWLFLSRENFDAGIHASESDHGGYVEAEAALKGVTELLADFPQGTWDAIYGAQAVPVVTRDGIEVDTYEDDEDEDDYS